MEKMKTSVLTLLAVATLVTTTQSCKKNGTGGKAEIHAMVANNSTPIYSSTAYVKFDAHHQPSNPTTDYDLKVEGEATDNHVHIEDLRPGEYYIYCVGTNTVTNKVVKGGVAVEIKWKDRKQTIEADIAATE